MGKILVTGATGFTGGNLCKQLVKQGKQVVAFVRSGPRVAKLREMGVECRDTDIRDPEDVNDNFQGIEQVYHIAAAYRTEHADESEFWRVNVGATRNLLNAAKTANARRFVHCSTVGVQGEISDPPADEDYRFKPGDHYQESKKEGELLARQHFSDGLPGVVVRPVGIYGPGDIRFLKLFRPVSKGAFVMIGSGNVLYHMTYITDLVQGILLAGTSDAALGQVFTIGGPKYTTVRELVDTIAEVLGKPRPRLRVPYGPVYAASVVCNRLCKLVGCRPPLYPRRVEFFAKNRAFNIEKARHLLGYEPEIGLRAGLARTAAWYREQGLI